MARRKQARMPVSAAAMYQAMTSLARKKPTKRKKKRK